MFNEKLRFNVDPFSEKRVPMPVSDAGIADGPLLRRKFALLILASIPGIILFRMPYRIVALISGDFIRSGIAKIRHLRAVRMLEGKPLGRWEFRKLVVCESLKNLTKNVAKIATLPFAALGLFGSSLIGLIHPSLGRFCYSKIEDLWSRDVECFTPRFFFAVSEYVAPCMQDLTIWKEKNLFGDFIIKEILEKKGALLSTETREDLQEFLDDPSLFNEKEKKDIQAALEQICSSTIRLAGETEQSKRDEILDKIREQEEIINRIVFAETPEVAK